jgi:hypothetical protein
MVSSIIFAYIHCRLNELFPSTSQSFGEKNILIFGDLLQVGFSPLFSNKHYNHFLN